jgi:hypothetical protein
MKNLHYEDLKPQDYLRNLDGKEAKNISKFRVKMDKFSGNYNYNYTGPPEPCLLCGNHDVKQEM